MKHTFNPGPFSQFEGEIMRGTPVATKLNQKRLVIFFGIVVVLLTVLLFRLGWYQIIRSEYFSTLAAEQQTQDTPITAKRGIIYDRNGKELVVNTVTYTIWAWPKNVASGKTDEAKATRLAETTKVLAELLEVDELTMRATLTQEKSLVRVKKYVDRTTAEAIRAEGLPGISIAEDVKRSYPLGAFASHVLGSTTDDNQGLAGLEMWYNSYLSGTAGRWITSTDGAQQSLGSDQEKYYEAEDGLSLVLTIDEVIQHYTEKAIARVQNDTQAKRVWCLVMDPKTGDVLAMAQTPEYDPNDPRTPLDETEAAYVAGLSNEEKMEYWNQMWRNSLVSDVYEPGSTFKLLTTAIALEEGVTKPTEMFNCSGFHTVAGTNVTLKCWRSYNPHGSENLTMAVRNSCNPVFIQLAQRLGKTTIYDYLELFGLMGRTGIDYPGEAYNLLQAESAVGPVELATISYGQGIATTPISMLTAISALGNGGYLMEPRLVKELVDSDGNVVERYEPVVLRQVLSSETCAEMQKIMEFVVEDGGAGAAKIAGYRIGGKTGTADKVENGAYRGNTYSSTVALAPIDDPRLAILLVVDSPQGVKYGSITAAPGVGYILQDTLRYLNIQPQYSEEELAQQASGMTVVPNVTGEHFSVGIGVLAGAGLKYEVSPADESGEDFSIVDQYPKAGETVKKGTVVYLYRK